MRLLFNLFAFLTVLSFLGNIASVAMETLSGYRNFSVSGTELTVTFSPLDRILLGTWLVCLMFAVYFWQRMSKRR
jgi:hypothetical protein